MVVGQMRVQLASFWPATGRHRSFLIDIERCRSRPRLGRSDRIGVAQEPDIVLWIVRRRKGTASLRPAHDANDIDNAMRSTLSARGRILAIGRHETAIDKDDAATGKPGRSKYPIARALHIGTQRRPDGIDKRFFTIEEFGRESHATKFFSILTELRPAGARRQIFRSAAQPRINRRDQIFLPDLAIELPDAEPDQKRDAGQGHECRIEYGRFPLAPRLAHVSLRPAWRPSAAL